MGEVCDCEHNSHDPAGVRQPIDHAFAAVPAVAAVKSPWGATFHLCAACIAAGHLQGLQ